MDNMQTGKTNELKVINYDACPMTRFQHIALFIGLFLVFTAVFFVFYHSIVYSAVLAVPTAVIMEKNFANGTIDKRRRTLKLQFRDLLESMSVSVRAGGNELMALESAYKDLSLTYNDNADIMVELKTIILKNKNGGIPLRDLFADFAKRSKVDDVESFAEIFEVIETKSNRFGEIISNTHQIISDKLEIEQEIETMINSAKTESYIMLVMPVVITLAMSSMGGELMAALFTTGVGKITATAAIIIFLIAFFLAQKMSKIDV